MPATKAEVANIVAETVAGERLRIMGILQSKEGRARPKAAQNLALNFAMSVDQATSFLAEQPVESPFLEAMDREGPTGLKPTIPGPGGTGVSTDSKEARRVELAATVKAYNKSKGYTA